VTVLVKAIKEQQQTIAQLQTQLQQTVAELASFKEKMSRIEASLQKLAAREKTDRSLAVTGQ
jgi:septal ring factor EnvC (AmiA/AmiB activator)